VTVARAHLVERDSLLNGCEPNMYNDLIFVMSLAGSQMMATILVQANFCAPCLYGLNSGILYLLDPPYKLLQLN